MVPGGCSIGLLQAPQGPQGMTQEGSKRRRLCEQDGMKEVGADAT